MELEIILNFWFNDVGPSRWFKSNPTLDETLRSSFLEAHERAVRGELAAWQETPEGMLTLLLLFDMLPRCAFRGTPRAYATDDQALELARVAVIRHFDDRIDKNFKLFYYLPFSHAENTGDQRLGVYYIRERTKEPAWVDAAEARMEIIRRFGRFPHRNAILGRESTPEEKNFLLQMPEEP